jgi:glycosyltransferase involved in cell wall biosynthesis
MLVDNKIHPWHKLPSVNIIKTKLVTSSYTVVMPVFNQEEIIYETLRHLYNSASLQFDLIIILDGCSDNTPYEMNRFFATLKHKKRKNFGEITIICNPNPLYETACDNQGFRLAKTEYIMELQADIIINDFGFDKRMLGHFSNSKFSAIGGRHVHSFSFIDRFKLIKYPKKCLFFKENINFEIEGRYNNKIFDIPQSIDKSSCYIGETVARGPWLLKKTLLTEHNFLDQKHFFLGNDDHDFHRRAFQKNKLLTAYCPVKLFSREYDGSTRKKRFGINKQIFDWLAKNKKGSLGFKFFMMFYFPYKDIEKKIDCS